MGYAHPDHLLEQLTSKQIADWMAFGMLEPVGNPVPADPEEQEKKKRKTQRANFEGGMRALKDNGSK